MEGQRSRESTATNSDHAPPLLHTLTPSRRTVPNRVFAAVYICVITALFYRHVQTILHSTTLISFSLTLALFVSDLILAFLWVSAHSFRVRPVYRKEYPENIEKFLEPSDFPGLDIFIFTTDPYLEPPTRVVNTALSVMAYEYPTDKISIYVSDDGGSALSLFAFMEAAKFAAHWLPFFEFFDDPDINRCMPIDITMLFVNDQVLLNKNRDRDITGHCLPNLVYVSRQKSPTSPYNFKAGALNVRVLAAMTNAPIILTLDCDMYSNDPRTPFRALCYVLDPAEIQNRLAFVQFPQQFHGLNESEIHGSEHRRLFKLNPFGLDGLSEPNYLGTGCFIHRRALLGDPSTLVPPVIKEISPAHIANNPITAPSVLEFAHRLAGCHYENQTEWGSKIGFRYGSLVEDFFTGFRLQCEEWRSIFCNPEKAAFLGNAPINFRDFLGQNKRWQIGLLEAASS
ncbi:Cellulose synthase-like protein G1 [Hibiscus syriacus]|uniref:Cellulose synthase-like protein G1 n=1 Tax=Hibiscus syriacus TaxID=106335 RepID=A0A6A3A1V3_HIBSY|nr:Cellulose synthase-like protein G1 [Hibiscus syriacus]